MYSRHSYRIKDSGSPVYLITVPELIFFKNRSLSLRNRGAQHKSFQKWIFEIVPHSLLRRFFAHWLFPLPLRFEVKPVDSEEEESDEFTSGIAMKMTSSNLNLSSCVYISNVAPASSIQNSLVLHSNSFGLQNLHLYNLCSLSLLSSTYLHVFREFPVVVDNFGSKLLMSRKPILVPYFRDFFDIFFRSEKSHVSFKPREDSV